MQRGCPVQVSYFFFEILEKVLSISEMQCGRCIKDRQRPERNNRQKYATGETVVYK